jgi:hypothetical protein
MFVRTKVKLTLLLNLRRESNEELIKNAILNVYFPLNSCTNKDEVNFTIKYKRLILFKMLGLPNYIYKRYYLILLYQNKSFKKLITFKERKAIGELLNKLLFKDTTYFVA